MWPDGFTLRENKLVIKTKKKEEEVGALCKGLTNIAIKGMFVFHTSSFQYCSALPVVTLVAAELLSLSNRGVGSIIKAELVA